MIKKSLVMIAIFALALVLVSGANGCGKSDTTDNTADNIFIGGTQGISVDFTSEEPSSQVFANEPFKITPHLKNLGEFTSKKIIATLSGVNKDSFSLISLDKEMIGGLEERNKFQSDFIPEDEIVFNANYKEDIRADFKPIIKADVCYIYGTYAVADVCLKGDVFDKDEGDSCVVGSVLSYENSGAPVQITDVSARPAGKNEIKLTFTIEQMDKTGIVYMNDAFENSCRGAADKKNKLLVKVDSTTLDANIKCSKLNDGKEGEVSLIDGKRVVSCTIETEGLQETSFSERLNFNLYYFFRESISKEITIKP